jgi:hypothetical protein
MDATGLVNLESALERLRRGRVFVILGGVQKQPLQVMARAEWKHRHAWLAIHGSMQEAVALARSLASGSASGRIRLAAAGGA